MAERRRSRKASEVMAHQLVDQIVDAKLPMGTSLPPEKDMIEEYGIGRATLREALRLLETRGVLTIRTGPRGGPVVGRPSAVDLSDALTLLLRFEGATLWDVFQAHCAIQPMVASLAAAKITKREIAELRTILRSMAELLDQPDRFLAESDRFHAVLLDVAGTVTLKVLAEAVRIVSYSLLADVPLPAETRPERLAHFERLFACLERRDADAAGEEMRTFLDEAGRHWRTHYKTLVDLPVRWTS